MSEKVTKDEFAGMAQKVTSLVRAESDRGAILVLSAYLEEILGFIVRAACVTDLDADKILEFRGPAGGFDLKIQLCKALALIHPDEVKALDLVRKLRNSAAHFDTKHGFDVLFDSEPAVARVEGLAKLCNLEMRSRAAKDVRSLFVVCVRLLATKLYTRLEAVHRPLPLTSIKEKAKVYREQFANTRVGQDLAEAEAEARDGNPEKLFKILAKMREVFTVVSSNSGVDLPENFVKIWDAVREELEVVLSESGVQKVSADSDSTE